MAVSYSASSVTVKDGATSASFTVKRSGTTSELDSATSVDFATADASATAGTDYTETSGSLSFASGVTEGTITVAILSEAYRETTTKSFLLELSGYGMATCSIIPTDTTSTTQTYLYVPDDDNSVTVPTASDPGTNLQHQALYSGFSAPEDSSVNMPMAYIRLGYAGSDMNEYERVILNSDNYHPNWLNDDDDDPEEFGPMMNFSLPRPINRYDNDDWEDEETDNAHLDGVFIYSDASYSLTVSGQHSTIVKGDYIREVTGKGRILWYGVKAEWIYVWGEEAFLYASGLTSIEKLSGTFLDGIYAVYTISNIALYNVNSSLQVTYNLSAQYTVTSDVKFTYLNDASYTVSNGLSLNVGGLEISGSCDIYGNYSASYPGGASVKTQSVFSQAASTSITLSVQTGYSSAWTTMLQVAAAANALAGVGIAASDAAVKFKLQGEFYENASPDLLDDEYTEAFGTVVLDSCVVLGLATSILLVAACIAQQVAELVSEGLPKIEMDATGMTLSCGSTSQLVINTTGVYVTAGIFDVLCTNATVSATGAVEVDALTTIGLEAATTEIVGETTISENLTVAGNMDAALVYGTLFEAI